MPPRAGISERRVVVSGVSWQSESSLAVAIHPRSRGLLDTNSLMKWLSWITLIGCLSFVLAHALLEAGLSGAAPCGSRGVRELVLSGVLQADHRQVPDRADHPAPLWVDWNSETEEDNLKPLGPGDWNAQTLTMRHKSGRARPPRSCNRPWLLCRSPEGFPSRC